MHNPRNQIPGPTVPAPCRLDNDTEHAAEPGFLFQEGARMRLRMKAENKIVGAVLTTEHPTSSYGIPVLATPDGDAYGPAEASAIFELVEATSEELDALTDAGFYVPRVS